MTENTMEHEDKQAVIENHTDPADDITYENEGIRRRVVAGKFGLIFVPIFEVLFASNCMLLSTGNPIITVHSILYVQYDILFIHFLCLYLLLIRNLVTHSSRLQKTN